MLNLSRRWIIGSCSAFVGGSLLKTNRSYAATDTLRVGMVNGYGPVGIVAWAKKNGYFGDLSVEITEYKGAGPAEALVAGAADLAALAAPTLALAIAKGAKAKILALSGPPSSQGFYLVASKASGVTDMKGLDGASVGISTAGSESDLLVSWSARTSGVKLNKIPLGSARLPAMNAGQVKAIALASLTSFQAIKHYGATLIQDYGSLIPNAAFDTWSAMDSAIASKGELIARFFKGMEGAIKHLQSDEKAGLDFLAGYYEESDAEILRLAYNGLIRTMIPNNAITLEGVRTALRLAEETGVKNLPKAEDIIDTSLIPK